MRRPILSGGFFLSLILNLFFNLEWVALSFILFLLHKFLNLPLWPSLVALGIWFGGVLIVTLILSILSAFAKDAPSVNDVKNKNPYSKGSAAKEASKAAGDSKPALEQQNKKTAESSVPQFKSELARSIMQPPTFSQPDTKD